eukprot:SAG31_NODE_1753_length_7350_cov_1.885395_5_plen_178_part_00
MRTSFEKTSDKVCRLQPGDRVYCDSRKRRSKNDSNSGVRMRVRLWGDFPLLQEGWISEVASGGQQCVQADNACGHTLYRNRQFCRGWVLCKDTAASQWERRWYQVGSSMATMELFSTNTAGEGAGAVGNFHLSGAKWTKRDDVSVDVQAGAADQQLTLRFDSILDKQLFCEFCAICF